MNRSNAMSDELDPSPSRDQRVDALIAAYLEAVDAGRAPDRQELLARHPELASELEAFFADHDRVDQLAQPLRVPSPPPSQRTEPEEGVTGVYGATQPAKLASGETPLIGPPLGTKVRYIGDYELLEELGRGGMGVVYKARQSKLNRLVALKMILAGEYAGDKEVARFRTEAEAVARLQHPNIVQIFEVGEHDGHPYFSLEFVDGGSLAQQLDGTPLPPQQAARLVETLARAMHAAHQAGVVHRDLKPANVLLTADGTPKITDFGLAKKLGDAAGPTGSNAIMGTPSYMAPEQAGGGSKEVGPAADVYALGAILYELLTGRPPFKASTPLDTVLQVVSDEPVPPRKLQSKTPRDLETICLKCLHKAPGRRYASAEALADDLRRFQAGEPIAARPVGTVERAAKWVRRNPIVATLAFAVVAALLLGTAVSTVFGLLANANAQEASRKADDEKTARTETERQLERAKSFLLTAQLRSVAQIYEANPADALVLLDDVNACPMDHRDLAWRFYERYCRRGLFVGHAGRVTSVALSGDGKTLVSASSDKTIKVWDVGSGQERATLKGHTDTVWSVALSDDGKTLVSASWDDMVKVWDMGKGRESATLKGHMGAVTPVALSGDGKTLAWGSEDNTVKVWDVGTGQERATLKGHTNSVYSVALSRDGKTLGSGSWDGTVKVWDVATGRERAALKGHNESVFSVALSGDGKTLVSGSLDATVKVWDVATGQERATLNTGLVNSVALSDDGKTLVSASWDATVKVWDMATGQERATLKAHTAMVNSVALSGDGKTLASGSEDNTVKVWKLGMGQERATLKGHTAGVTSVALSGDGKSLVSASQDKTIKVWDVGTGQERATLNGHTAVVRSVAWSGDGKTLVSGSEDNTVKVWDVDTGQERAILTGHAALVMTVALSGDGKTLVSASWDKTVKVWDMGTRQERATLKGYRNWDMSVALSGDGKTLVSGSDDGTVKVWDVGTGQERATLKGPTSWVTSVALSGDGKTLVSGYADSTVKVWDMATGQERATLSGHRDAVTSLALSDDGKTLISGSGDKTIKIWDVDTGQERATLKGHTDQVLSVALSGDNRTLVSGSADGTIKVWDVGMGQEADLGSRK
jgi:WD40 repeat protein/tRNA A-37 threonylcarbamoyl transferase component Bud32